VNVHFFCICQTCHLKLETCSLEHYCCPVDFHASLVWMYMYMYIRSTLYMYRYLKYTMQKGLMADPCHDILRI